MGGGGGRNNEKCCPFHGLELGGCLGRLHAAVLSSPRADVNALVIGRCHSGERDVHGAVW